MKKGIGSILILFLFSGLLSAQQPLAITRVLLYKNGMAYIVRSGQIAGPVSLTFHPDDMNDVLKTFTAWNPVTGALYSVGYTTGIPSSRTLARFPFDISAPGTGLGGFLIQVKGAELRLDHSGKDIQGKLVAVQETAHSAAQQTSMQDYRLTVLLRDGALQTVWLSDVRLVEFVDPQLRDQLRSYLEVLAVGRQDVTREVSVYPVPAPGPIQIGYLQQFPLWKTSYRIDLAEPESRIQGWAQIDNPTGEPWENVQVSLLSGAPVSFLMDLYNPLYTNRSKVPVPNAQVAAPRVYESAVTINPDLVGEVRTAVNVDAAPARGNGQIQITTRSGTNSGPLAGSFPQSFQATDSTQVGDFFEYKFPFPVRIASRQSALLPFLQKTVNAERLSIFNARLDRGNARLGARIHNSTDVPFEAGPITFFQDTRYAGEAVMEYLPRGERRLISYGIDYDIQVSRKDESKPATTTRLTVSKGVAVLYMESSLTASYAVRNKGTENKTLIIEHPRSADRKLRGIQPFETSDGFYRFRVALGPGESSELVIPEILSQITHVELGELERDDLLKFAGKETPQTIREKLGQIVEFQERLATMRGDLTTTQKGIDALFHDQDRLRENLKALRDSSDDQQLRARYLDQLKKQEDRIDSSRTHIDAVDKDVAELQVRLSDLISNLTFGNP